MFMYFECFGYASFPSMHLKRGTSPIPIDCITATSAITLIIFCKNNFIRT